MPKATSDAQKQHQAEADVILNRVSVALARSHRLIDAWIPASTSQVAADDDERQLEGLPDRLGLGAAPPDQSSSGAADGPSGGELDKLRKQLQLRKGGTSTATSARPGLNASKPMNGSSRGSADSSLGRRRDDSDEEEEGGRSSAFKPKRQQSSSTDSFAVPSTALEDASAHEEPSGGSKQASTIGDEGQTRSIKSAKKRGTSFLDEVLAESSAKKKKKKNKKQNTSTVDNAK